MNRFGDDTGHMMENSLWAFPNSENQNPASSAPPVISGINSTILFPQIDQHMSSMASDQGYQLITAALPASVLVPIAANLNDTQQPSSVDNIYLLYKPTEGALSSARSFVQVCPYASRK